MWGLKNQFFDIPFSNNETMPFPKTSNRKDKPPEKEKTNIKLPSWIVECESGIKIEFTGKPNSKIEGVTAMPVKGEANEAFLKYFSDVLEVKSSEISLIKGSKSHDKTVLINKKIDLQQVYEKLKSNVI